MQNLIPTMVSQWVTVKNNSCQVQTSIGIHSTHHTHSITYTPALGAHALSDQNMNIWTTLEYLCKSVESRTGDLNYQI
jgi:hypothetical protein